MALRSQLYYALVHAIIRERCLHVVVQADNLTALIRDVARQRVRNAGHHADQDSVIVNVFTAVYQSHNVLPTPIRVAVHVLKEVFVTRASAC